MNKDDRERYIKDLMEDFYFRKEQERDSELAFLERTTDKEVYRRWAEMRLRYVDYSGIKT